MSVHNALKMMTVASIGAIVSGAGLPMSQQEADTHAVAIPKFEGEIAQAGFICDQSNYLPWRAEFEKGGTGYIDGIKPEHLDKPVQCGIDPWRRPFIAFKYICTRVEDSISEVTKGAVAIFQRYSDVPTYLQSGGHYTPKGCYSLGPIDPGSDNFGKNFKEFLKGKPVQHTSWDGQISELTLCNEKLCPPDQLQLPSPEL